MWLYSLCIFALISAKCVSCELNVFHKCCHEDENLVKIYENKTSNYQCKSLESTKLEYEIFTSPLIISKDLKISYGMPDKCEQYEIEEYEIEKMVELTSQNNGCYDILVLELQHEKLIDEFPKTVLLKCKLNETKKTINYTLKIDHIRKCCPAKHAYNIVNKACTSIVGDINEKWLVREIKNWGTHIYQVDTGISCKETQYTVDLMSDEFTLDVYGSNLYALRKSMDDERRLREGEWCMDRRKDIGGLVARICTSDASVFGAYPIRKCCPVGKHFEVQSCTSMMSNCVPNTDHEFTFNMSIHLDALKKNNDNFPDLLGVRTSLRCPEGNYVTDGSQWEDQYSLNLDGTLQLMNWKEDEYCLEEFDRRHCRDNKPIVVEAVVCFADEELYVSEVRKNFHVSFVLNTISAVFLALILLVYIMLPELRNLHGCTLICHSGTMLLGFSFLARVQYGMVESSLCAVFGYIIYFGFVSAFAWLNVICLDIWWTFGRVRTVHRLQKRRAARRRFLWYSLYAWSFAIVLTMTMFLLDTYPVAEVLDADIGTGYCWFDPSQNSDWPHYIFFVIPMGLVTFANFVLWAMTARHCARVKAEVQRMQASLAEHRTKSRFSVDKDKHILTGKLFVVMGAGWLTEILSTVLTEPKWLWEILDHINSLQGLFLFIILIVKPKVYYMIRKRLNKDYLPAIPFLNHRRSDRADHNGLDTVTCPTISTTISPTIQKEGAKVTTH